MKNNKNMKYISKHHSPSKLLYTSENVLVIIFAHKNNEYRKNIIKPNIDHKGYYILINILYRKVKFIDDYLYTPEIYIIKNDLLHFDVIYIAMHDTSIVVNWKLILTKISNFLKNYHKSCMYIFNVVENGF